MLAVRASCRRAAELQRTSADLAAISWPGTWSMHESSPLSSLALRRCAFFTGQSCANVYLR
ncbi:hypothetical protein C8T65DRAFT_649690 [Cerioporus squamosus]|nr:hypothetical protein C8T65DRAFT_649690 [Cerioporus squamosus]